MVGRIVSHYRIVRELGAGGMGVVYEAEDARLGRRVALKFLPERLACDHQALDRFRREARAASALNHPHICTIYDIDEAGLAEGAGQTTPFIAMELLEGESLRGRLRQGRLAVTAIVETGIQLADALESAHARGIVHRDIKPENVVITTRGSAKLLDFGIAKLASEHPAMTGADTLTRIDTGPLALGTLAYMSPEQVRGEPLDGRTDLFSLGVVLYELLTGVQPFRGTTSGAVVGEILTKAPTAPVRLNAAVPPEFERIVNKLLEKDRELRYQSARDVRVDLERLRRAHEPGAAAGLARAPDDASIVVLPFENLCADADNSFFADGLTEEIITDLSKLHALRVISRNSAMQLKKTTKDTRTIGRELNVRYVLAGSVRRAGNQLRVTAQLSETAQDAQVWAEKYNGSLDDVFEIQERLSRTIVDALKVRLTPDEDRWLAARRLPDAGAFDLYVKARGEMYKMTPDGLSCATALVDRALAIAGANAVLWATKGQIEFHSADTGLRPEADALADADSWSERALEAEPDCAPAVLVKALLAWKRGRMRDAVSFARRASILGNGEALTWLTYFCFQAGRTADVREAAEKSVSVDPLFWFGRWALAIACLAEGQFDQALAHMRSGVVAAGADELSRWWLAPFLVYAGRRAEASNVFEALAGGSPGWASESGRLLGPLIVGDLDAFRRAAESSWLPAFARGDKEMSWQFAVAFACAGERDQALDWLGNAIELGMCNHRFWSEVDPVIAPLCSDARFATLMARAKEKEREWEAGAVAQPSRTR